MPVIQHIIQDNQVQAENLQIGEEIASHYITVSSFRLEKILLYSVVLQKALRKAEYLNIYH